MIEAEDTVPSTAAAFRPWQPADTVVLNLTAEPNEDDGTIELSWGAPTYERFQIRDYRYRIDARNWKTVGPNVLSVLIDAVSNQLWGGAALPVRGARAIRHAEPRVRGKKGEHLGRGPRQRRQRLAAYTTQPVP